jgi:Tfp pilus assembly protein PilN
MINLLPTNLKDEIRFGRLNITLVQYTMLVVSVSIALVAVLLFGVGVVSADERSLKKNIEERQVILSGLSSVTQEAQDLESTVNTISALLEREIEFSKLLKDIGAVIPSGASLTGLALTGDESVPLQIDAEISTQSLAAVLRENLEDSNLFQGADIQSISIGDVNQAGAALNYQVRIVVNFEQPGAQP